MVTCMDLWPIINSHTPFLTPWLSQTYSTVVTILATASENVSHNVIQADRYTQVKQGTRAEGRIVARSSSNV